MTKTFFISLKVLQHLKKTVKKDTKSKMTVKIPGQLKYHNTKNHDIRNTLMQKIPLN